MLPNWRLRCGSAERPALESNSQDARLIKSMRKNKSQPRKYIFAREMRKKPTKAEALVWSELRFWRYAKARFYRQAVLRGYIADFYCPKAKLVVEIDGPIHVAKKDRIRDSHLAKNGIEVLRFTNREVFLNLHQVLVEIRKAYRGRKHLRKRLKKKRVKKTRRPYKPSLTKVSTNPQASSSQYIETVNKKGFDDCPCGYVQISDIHNNCIKLIRLPLFESVLRKKEESEGCPEQTFSSEETATNFAAWETKANRESTVYRCSFCNQFHVQRKALTRLAVVR